MAHDYNNIMIFEGVLFGAGVDDRLKLLIIDGGLLIIDGGLLIIDGGLLIINGGLLFIDGGC